MAFFKTNDHERELLEAHYRKEGLDGEALDEAVADAKREMEQGKPLAYITGEQAFYDLVFSVDERVLIPRPDTERLVEKALSLLPAGASFADLGTGSGCVAVTVLHHRKDVTALALDKSEGALAVAQKNAEAAGVLDRLRLLHGDMLENPLGNERFALILSNPPYIPQKDMAAYPSLAYEPQEALVGGEDGLDFYRCLLKDYRGNLAENGAFLLEIGYDQKKAILALAAQYGYEGEVYKDYGGNDRVAYLVPVGK